MRESALERRFVSEVRKIGGQALKWVSPGNRGVPDRLVILPGGRTIFVEMKSPGKPLEPLQEKWFKILRGLGHQVYKVDSLDGIEIIIKSILRDGSVPTLNENTLGHTIGIAATKNRP